MSNKHIYFVRHSEPELRGMVKLGLSKRGMVQAANVAKTLSESLNDDAVILYSPVLRCKQTAQQIALKTHCKTKEAPLRILGIEKLKNRRLDTSKLSFYRQNHAQLGLESPRSYMSRILDLLSSLHETHIIVVCHELTMQLFTGQSTVSHGSCICLQLADGKLQPTRQ